MKKKNIHIVTMMLGFILALAVICSHVFQVSHAAPVAKVKSEQKSDQSDQDLSFVTAPTITPPASAHVHSNLLAHCLFEIIQPEEGNESDNAGTAFHPQKFLMTLFRVIIAPNAP
jgi:hypothetical protein